MATANPFEESGARAVETLAALGGTRETGLARKDADARLRSDGPNEIAEKKRHPVLISLRKFLGLSAWMIELIIIISFLLGKRPCGNN